MDFKINKNSEYITICNYHLSDKALSLKSKGLLSIMLSLPSDWDYSVKGLTELCATTEYEIVKILKELEDRKYLLRNKEKNEKGQYQFLYEIFEKPYPQFEGVDSAKPYPQFEGVDDRNYYNNISTTNNSYLGKNTNIDISTNTKINFKELKERNNKERKKESLSANSTDFSAKTPTQLFEEVWKIYPRKIGKKKSCDSFLKALKTTEFEKIKQGVENYNTYIKQNHIDPSFIKHGSTWFNQQCWNDDYNITNSNEPDWLYEYYNSVDNNKFSSKVDNNSTTNTSIEEFEELFKFKK